MSQITTKPDLYGALLKAYEMTKGVYSTLSGLNMEFLHLRHSQGYKEAAIDIRLAMDTLDEFNLAMFRSANSDATDEELLAIALKATRTVRLILGCMSFNEDIAYYKRSFTGPMAALREVYLDLSKLAIANKA
jgi:hypothetical protein